VPIKVRVKPQLVAAEGDCFGRRTQESTSDCINESPACEQSTSGFRRDYESRLGRARQLLKNLTFAARRIDPNDLGQFANSRSRKTMAQPLIERG
jgi:hypothetical protein